MGRSMPFVPGEGLTIHELVLNKGGGWHSGLTFCQYCHPSTCDGISTPIPSLVGGGALNYNHCGNWEVFTQVVYHQMVMRFMNKCRSNYLCKSYNHHLVEESYTDILYKCGLKFVVTHNYGLSLRESCKLFVCMLRNGNKIAW